MVPENIRLSGIVPDPPGVDDSLQRGVDLFVYLAKLVFQPIFLFYTVSRTYTEHNTLYHYNPGIHGALYFIT